nr:Uncharacterised protein family UPF0005 domain containing protein [Haemonchus contortus]
MSNEPVAPPHNPYNPSDDDYRGQNIVDRNSCDEHDIEGYGKNAIGFDNASIRAGFVRKVFFIVTIMLLVVILMVTPVVVNTELRMMIIRNRWIYSLAFVVFFATFCTLACCRSVARNFPMNLILLAIFTIAAGLILAVICALASPQSVLLALITTTLSCGAIILFASQTSYDVTTHIFLIYAASCAVFIFGIALGILQFFVYIKMLHIIFAAVACVLFMVYLALDTQMIIGGRKYEISPEEYVYAALMLFVDIYEIFIMLLSLFQAAE